MSRAKCPRYTERFAAIPISVLQSEAWRTLPHAARTALTILAVQYNGTANGVQNLHRATCRRYGIEHSHAHRLTHVLEERGLIVNTYRAKYSTSKSRVASQWAVAWRDITHRNTFMLARVEKAPRQWANWHPPEKIQSGSMNRSDEGIAVENAAVISENCGSPATQGQNTAVRSTTYLESRGTRPESGDGSRKQLSPDSVSVVAASQ